jgi:hypothetical protein
MSSQAANERDSSQTVLEYLVVKRDEERPYVFRLCKMFVETFMERAKDNVSNARFLSKENFG